MRSIYDNVYAEETKVVCDYAEGHFDYETYEDAKNLYDMFKYLGENQ